MLQDNQIYHGDCFELMQYIADHSVDMLFTDPPYAITRAKWDVPIDWDVWWKEAYRVLKPNGNILCFACTPFDKILACTNLKDFKYEYIWYKNTGTNFLNSSWQPIRRHENILVFFPKITPEDKATYGERTYHIIKTTGHPRKVSLASHKQKTKNNQSELWNKSDNFTDYDSTERFPTTILEGFGSDKQKEAYHPTQKPLALCEHLIRIYTNEGDLVLDPFAGAFSIPLAAKNLNRRFIGIEKEEKYFNVGLQRCFFTPK